MKKHSFQRRGSPRDDYLTVVTDLNGYVSFTLDHLTLAQRDALHVVGERLSRGDPGVEGGALCGRCGARVWLEPGENGLPLPVEGDGSPHRDGCSASSELPLLALQACRERAKQLAQSREATSEVPEVGESHLLSRAATRECWNILQDAKALLQCHEAMMLEGESLPNVTLEEVWALVEGVEAVEARFGIIGPDLFALLGSLDKLHRRLRFVARKPRERVREEKEE